MASRKVTSKTITISRMVNLVDDVEKPTPAYEFGQGKTIYQKPQAPGEPYKNRFIREENIDPSLR